jgi:hypothetical protein
MIRTRSQDYNGCLAGPVGPVKFSDVVREHTKLTGITMACVGQEVMHEDSVVLGKHNGASYNVYMKTNKLAKVNQSVQHPSSSDL